MSAARAGVWRLVCLVPALQYAGISVAAAQAVARPPASISPSSATRVGPPRGAVLVVGGGALGPEVLERFIELAGGPEALIIDVPTAGGDSTYPSDWQGTRALRAAGAKNIVVLHTIDRKVASADSFVAPITRAGGVWFEGGRQWHLVDSYAGTKTERAFHDVLARGGVVGGSSAGASILGSYLLRGAREGNWIIMAPGYEVGFGFLRGVAIDQHVVARERLADLADSLLPKHPELLGISEDEGTAWLIRGDTADIIGRNKAFVYGGRDPNESGKPFLTLFPGDRYNLATRRVMHRAIDDSPLTGAFVDSLVLSLSGAGRAPATVLVAHDGKVLIDRSYGIPPQRKYMPTTTLPNFPLLGLSQAFETVVALQLVGEGKLRLDEPLADGSLTVRRSLEGPSATTEALKQLATFLAKRGGSSYAQLVNRRIFLPIGAHKTVVSSDGQLQSSVDELYRFALGLEYNRAFTADTANSTDASSDTRQATTALGWQNDLYRGLTRLALYGTPTGKRNAFVRIPEHRMTIIVLTGDDTLDAKSFADRITDRLLSSKAAGTTR